MWYNFERIMDLYLDRDNDLKKKSKKISELTKDISEYLDENVKLNFIKGKEKY